MAISSSQRILEEHIARDPVGASECQQIIDRDAAMYQTARSGHALPECALFLLLRLAYNAGFVKGMTFAETGNGGMTSAEHDRQWAARTK